MWSPSQDGCAFGIVQAPPELAANQPQRATPGFHHLAFNAASRQEIDDLYTEVLLKTEASILDPPGTCPDYGPTYYTVYFEDPDGLKLELAHS